MRKQVICFYKHLEWGTSIDGETLVGLISPKFHLSLLKPICWTARVHRIRTPTNMAVIGWPKIVRPFLGFSSLPFLAFSCGKDKFYSQDNELHRLGLFA